MLGPPSYIVHVPEVQPWACQGVGVPHWWVKGFLVSLYGLGQSSPHEIAFEVELGPRFILDTLADCLSHSNSNLFQLSNLKRLDLSRDDFSGLLIPTKFGELSSLTCLYLEYSGFTGVIPAEISHLSKLQVLSISTVDPYGLHLDSVSICSTIPLNFSSYLTTPWLPRTQLHGVLPERVFHLSYLEHLDLSFNSLTGPIPSNVSGLQNLQLLYLSSNYWNGTIPSCIFSLSSLQLFDLRNNSFSGKIQEFKFNNTLEFVSVKQNQLQGPIPKSLLDLQDLKFKTAKN
ncbi:hypothetical protein CQW23_19092 [Capsicum baccatum]|uniref:Uncharacterized protein n=1 Tax=Capsicum baccatum TaxID=33114 RepID=A0A2G2W4U0_CAPBA|nr:hypothetical protein CQW23_19092 [Capsicum baccatum]